MSISAAPRTHHKQWTRKRKPRTVMLTVLDQPQAKAAARDAKEGRRRRSLAPNKRINQRKRMTARLGHLTAHSAPTISRFRSLGSPHTKQNRHISNSSK